MNHNIDKSFLGTGWKFPPTFRKALQTVEMVSAEEDVRNSIEVIIQTITGERVMLPDFGCNLQPFIFEPMNVPTIALIEKNITDALVLNEPRIKVHQLQSVPKLTEGYLEITINYSIITTNTRYNYVFPFYMTEATNLVT